MSETFRDTNKIKEMAIGIFGEERVDMQLRRVSAGQTAFNLVIHFPEIEINNSENSKHIIKDLFVRLSANILRDGDSGYRMHLGFDGMRTTLSLKEFQSGYNHSHLQRNLHEWCSFCLGASSYGQILENAKMECTEELWEYLLVSLTSYVSWESLEGGPYMKMRDIMYIDGNSRLPQQRVSEAQILAELYRLAPFIPYEVWEFSPNMSLIESHPSLYAFFNTYSTIRRFNASGNSNPGTNITQQTLDEAERTWGNNVSHITFKGNPVPFKVYDPIVSQEARLEDNSNHIEREIFLRFVHHLKNQSNTQNKKIHYESIKNTREPLLRALCPF